MQASPFMLSLDTVVALSPMLGHRLEERSRIREAQDLAIVEQVQKASTIPLSHPGQQKLFAVAPLDILVAERSGQVQFQIIETNGTGIGGLTNISVEATTAILEGLTAVARDLPGQEPVVLVASSGKESSRHPRLNKLIYEKILYVEAIRKGLEARHGQASVAAMPCLIEEPKRIETGGPLVILGYIKEFLEHLRLDANGRLSLFGRQVTAGVNDRFCQNVVSRFGGQVDLDNFQTMNRCFLAGSDKGVAYDLLNEYAQAHHSPYFPDRVKFTRVSSRSELISQVVSWLRQGRKVLIKPQGTGLGHGIEFFLEREEALDNVIARIDHAIRVTEHYYGAIGGAFPFTLCEFVNTRTIERAGHDIHGHRYELRVVVYRDRNDLKAFPSIVKVSSQGYDAAKPVRLSLINNITASAEAEKSEGLEFMMPLSNRETLALLGLTPEDLEHLCTFCTGYIRYVLDQVEQRPERFGLPGPRSAELTHTG